MKFKKTIRVLHLWLGFITGLVVVVLGVTGCIYAFADDIREAIYKERYYVSKRDIKLPLSSLLTIAQRSIGTEHPITRAKVYNLPDRSYEFRAIKTDPKAIGHWNYYVYYYRVYLDPYSGKVVYKEDTKNSFMGILLSLHMQLLLGKAIGHTVVKWSVIGFVILLISGMVLWWPKHWTRKQLVKGLTIKWTAKFKRLNYDLHNVAGFYAFLILLVIALSGLMMAFELSVVQSPLLSSDTTRIKPRTDLPDYVIAKAKAIDPSAALYYYNIPAKKSGTLNISAYVSADNFYQRTNYKYDQFSGEKLYHGMPFQKLNLAAKAQTLAFDVHTGNALGFWGKIMAFIGSLIAATLPITGFLIWLGKKKKNRSAQKENQRVPKDKLTPIPMN